MIDSYKETNLKKRNYGRISSQSQNETGHVEPQQSGPASLKATLAMSARLKQEY